MIASISRGSGFRGLLNYLLEDRELEDGTVERGQVVGGNLDGLDPRALAKEFKLARQMRPEVKKPVWHCSLGLPPGERVSPEKFAGIAAEFVQDMGFSGKHPWTLVLHEDKGHQHVHIVASRIAVDGDLWQGKNDFKKAMDVCRALEKRHGLTLIASPDPGERRAKKNAPLEISNHDTEVSMLSQPVHKTDRAVRAARRAERRGTQANDAVFLRVSTLDALKLAAAPATLKLFLAKKGIEVAFAMRQAARAEGAAEGAPAEGEIYGWKLRQAGSEEWLSGSSVHRDLSWARIRATLAANADREQAAQDRELPAPAAAEGAAQHQALPAAEVPAPAVAEAPATAEPAKDDRRQAEAKKISARVDQSLARLNSRDLEELRVAAMRQPDGQQLGGMPREPIRELLRRLLDLVLRLVSLNALRLGPSQAQAQAHEQAQARQELVARIEAEQQRRAERQALAQAKPKQDGEKPTLRLIKTHDARPPAAPQQPAEDDQEDQDQYPRERGG